MRITRRSLAALAVGGSLAVAAAPAMAQGPPPPTATNGNAVKAIGHGVPTPTSFAFGARTVFAGSGPDEANNGPGGLFTVNKGTATKIPGTPPIVFGLTWHKGKLYVAAGKDLIAYRGWDGTKFAGSDTLYHGKKSFRGFNGLAFGPDGRLYAGISLDQKYDHAKDPSKLAQSVVSMKADGSDLQVVARGLRQPFQMVFPKGSDHPYVTNLSQDETKQVPPDQIDIVEPGQDYGFPGCTWLSRKACKGFAKPHVLLPAHASPMGIGAIGRTLYVSLFGGLGQGPEVVTIPTNGKKPPKPILTGFAAPVIALGIHRGRVYVGDLTGTIYKVKA
jgi:glucose/arabinose dehydrogenase